MWRQRSRLDWLKHGDKNTKFFHHHATTRRQRNLIHEVLGPHGVWVNDQSVFSDLFVNHFHKLFFSQISDIDDNAFFGVRCWIIDEVNAMLCHPFNGDEVKNSLLQMFPTKAPRYDGIPTLFYRRYWYVVGDDLISAFLDVLIFKCGLGATNHTLIALVPKVKQTEHLSQYRPISLCIMFYKIILKKIVNWMKGKNIVHLSQGGKLLITF